jgi:hypothetical protein
MKNFKELLQQSLVDNQMESLIANLWKFHPDNPDAIDIVSEFGRLQREATSIEAYFQEKGIEFKEEEG